jgi:hypothetical protein
MAETFCRPVIDKTKYTWLVYGILAGAALFYVVARFMGWLTF